MNTEQNTEELLDILADTLGEQHLNAQVVKKTDVTIMTLIAKAYSVLGRNKVELQRGQDLFVDSIIMDGAAHFAKYKAMFGEEPSLYSIPDLPYLEYAKRDSSGGWTLAWTIQNFANLAAARLQITALRKKHNQDHSTAFTDETFFDTILLNADEKDEELAPIFNFVELYGRDGLHFETPVDNDEFIAKCLFLFTTPYIYVPKYLQS